MTGAAWEVDGALFLPEETVRGFYMTAALSQNKNGTVISSKLHGVSFFPFEFPGLCNHRFHADSYIEN